MQAGQFDSMGASLGPVVTYALAAIVVFVLLLVVLTVAKRNLRTGGTSATLRKGPRLAVIDVAAVDQRRKLVLIRRDDVEHLVLIGGQNDLVVEGGILRTPASANHFASDRTAAPRFDSDETSSSPVSNGRPAVVAPDPRAPFGDDDAPRAASPLRRTLPQQPAQRRRAPDIEPRREPPSAPEALSSEPPVAPPGPLLEPAIVSEAFETPVVQVPEPPASVPKEPERVAPPERVASDVPTNRPQATEPRNPVAPPPQRPASAPSSPSPAIPAFLQRTDTPPDVAEESAAEPVPPPEPPRSAPPPRPVAPPPSVTPRATVFERLPVRPVPAVAPANAKPPADEAPAASREPKPPATPAVRPDAPVAPKPLVAPPVAQAAPPVRAEPAPSHTPAAAEPPPSVEPADDADRRPLSVRSFASAIQSRRSVPEPTSASKPASSAERPTPDRFRTAATPTYPAREAAPPVPPPQPSAPAARAPIPDDGGLDDALSRELDSDLGSLDWAGENRTGSTKPEAVNAPPAEPAKADRKPTLEEEMERLLSDFDFGPSRR